MRKTWMEPQIEVQQFTSNEYVAACGDSGTVYKFKCTAGDGVSGSVYLETNGTPGLQTGWGGDQYLSDYYACGASHEAESTDAFLDGYYVVDGGWFGEDTITPVVVWRGPNNDNTHCTTILDKNDWETAKS